MFVNIIKSYRRVVAICDENLLGKRFEEGKFQLDVKENFYSGKRVEFSEVVDLIKSLHREDATFNIVGEESVNAAIEAGLIGKEQVKTIQKIPFTLVLI